MQKQDEKQEAVNRDDNKGHSKIEYMGTQTQELVGVSTDARKI
jgi:hypothetical protein